MIFSLGVILYIFIRGLPRVSDETELPKEPKISGLYLFLEEIDKKINLILERFFRRLKIIILKLDNFLSQKLDKFKKEEIEETSLSKEELEEK